MRKLNLDVKELQKEYLQDRATALTLAKKYNCGETTILTYLKSINNLDVLNKIKLRKYYNFKIQEYLCQKEGCNSKSKVCGYCLKHYYEIERQKYIKYDVNIDNSKIIYVTKYINNVNTYINCGSYIELIIYNKIKKHYFIVKVDSVSFDLIKKYVWGVQTNNYVSCKHDRKVLLLHKLLLPVNNKNYVDHKNRDKMDNRLINLREVCSSENGVNKSCQANNTSGITGVTWDESREKWKVSISIYNKTYNIGRFDNLNDAIKVRLNAEKIYHKEFTPIERK